MKKISFKSNALLAVESLANNLIHTKCVEVRDSWNLSVSGRSRPVENPFSPVKTGQKCSYAKFLLRAKSHIRIKEIVACLYACQQFYPHEVCRSSRDSGLPVVRFFCAEKKYPYKSSALPAVLILAHNLIHIFCAELGAVA